MESTGLFVFCLNDEQRYVPATHTIFPFPSDATAYMATIDAGRKPIAISRNMLFDALQGERFDFAERFETIVLDGVYTLHTLNTVATTMVEVKHPDGEKEHMAWIEFRTLVGGYVNNRALLETSGKIVAGASCELKTAQGTYKLKPIKKGK